jgi:hypothetical protein
MKIIFLLLLFIPFSFTQTISNNLMGKHVSSFSEPSKTVPDKDGFYEFRIFKDLLDEELSESNFKF